MEHTIKHTNRRPAKIFRIIGLVIGGIALAVLFAIAFGYFVMLLWNWLMPELFGLGEITYWQAFGIIILGKLIFGGFSSCHHKKSDDRHHEARFKNWVKEGTWKKDKTHFSKWKYYDEYWKEEGEQAFDEYIERRKGRDKESC